MVTDVASAEVLVRIVSKDLRVWTDVWRGDEVSSIASAEVLVRVLSKGLQANGDHCTHNAWLLYHVAGIHTNARIHTYLLVLWPIEHGAADADHRAHSCDLVRHAVRLTTGVNRCGQVWNM